MATEREGIDSEMKSSMASRMMRYTRRDAVLEACRRDYGAGGDQAAAAHGTGMEASCRCGTDAWGQTGTTAPRVRDSP